MNLKRNLSIAVVNLLVISVMLTGYAEANDCSLNLPLNTVIMTVHDGTISYFQTMLSNVPSGYDVTNGTYLGWCVDRRYTIPRGPTTHQVMLYSSCDPPTDLTGYDWSRVNYILNNKPSDADMMDIQEAIWYFIDMIGGYTPSSPDAWAIVNDADANGGGFVPGPCEIIAVICYPETETQITIIELRRCNPKQFTASGALEGFSTPEIAADGLSSVVSQLHTGPRIWWEVTYYFENSETYLGDEFDGEGHYFILWDKWGGNLMALDSPPTAFDEMENVVTLANGEEFSIDPRLDVTEDGYKGYIHPFLDVSDLASQGNAIITGHIGDQQQGTNPGKGKGSHPHGGKAYDADVRWEIGWLEPGDSAELIIYIAPGKNPGGKLQFSSADCYCINTGPRIRVYGDCRYEDFLYAIDKTVQLWVDVQGM